jgi:hypothetical protein
MAPRFESGFNQFGLPHSQFAGTGGNFYSTGSAHDVI